MSSKEKPGTSRHTAGSNRSETMDPLWSVGRCYVHPVSGLQIFGVAGLPEIAKGADLAALIADPASAAGTALADGDIIVGTSKIVSKPEGRTVELADIDPSP